MAFALVPGVRITFADGTDLTIVGPVGAVYGASLRQQRQQQDASECGGDETQAPG